MSDLERIEAKPDYCSIAALDAARARVWRDRNTRCGCDHNESCAECFPPAFHTGGYWDQQRALLQQSPAPPKLRAPNKIVALQAEIDALRATVERMTTALRDIRWHAKHGDAYAAEMCGKLANDALDGVKP